MVSFDKWTPLPPPESSPLLKGSIWFIATIFASAFATEVGLPPVIEMVGVST